jgi:hypothetical protein
MVFRIKPIERGVHVFHLAIALIMFALAQSGSTKIKPQHGKTETVQRLHGVKDNLVVQRSAEQRMGMTDQCGVRRVGRASVQQSFQTSGRPVEK